MKRILANHLHSKPHKTVYIQAFLLFILAFSLFITLSPKADAAISNIYPRADSAQSTSVLAVSSKAGVCGLNCSTGLDATNTYFKLFRKNPKYGGPTNEATVILKGACSNPYNGNVGDTAIEARALISKADDSYNWTGINDSTPPVNNYSSDCSGTDLKVVVPAIFFSDSQKARYTDAYVTAIINVKKTRDGLGTIAGTMHYRVVAPANVFVTFDDLSDNSYNANYPGFGAFALDEANPNGPAESWFRFVFEPDCRLQDRDVYLKWSDADDYPFIDGEDGRRKPANFDGDIGWTLKGSGTDMWRGGAGHDYPYHLGGQGWTAESRENVRRLTLNTSYTWQWNQVNRNNGVQLWMPFSEGMSLVSCPPPTGGATRAASCDVTVPPITGLPPNSVIAGEPFTVTATFTNKGSMTLLVGIYPGAPGPPYPPNANSSFNYGITFHNNDPNSYWFINPPNQYHNYYPSREVWVKPGQTTAGFEIKGLKAPTTPGSYTINFFPDHFGFGGAGGFVVDPPQGKRCPITLNVVPGFTLTPDGSVDLWPDSEYPVQANYGATIKGDNLPNSPRVSVQTSHALWLVRNGTPVKNLTDISSCTPGRYYIDGPKNWPTGDSTVPPPNPACQGEPIYGTHTQILSPDEFQAGDQVCIQVNVHINGFGAANGVPSGPKAIGYIGAGGAITSPQYGSAMSGCKPIVNQPYLSAYGADVVSGGGFEGVGNTCINDLSKSTISSYHKFGANGKGGSGGQFAAIALGAINGFVTSSSRTGIGDARNPKGLAFANTDMPPNLGQNRYAVGGKYGRDGVTLCAIDYWNKTRFPAGDPNLSTEPSNLASINDVGSLPSNKQTIYPSGDTELTINGGSLNTGQRHTVYVDGDVFIRNNITYNTANWDISIGTNNLPNFALIVRGNIYIGKDVTQLDGLYVAQPSLAANTGRIYTCAAGIQSLYKDTLGADSIWQNCGGADTALGNPDAKRLRINGAFVAQFVHFLRGADSLRDSTNNEPLGASRAAEIFSYSPEMYLSNPVFIDRNGNTLNQRFSSDYDYIVTLPPVL